MSNTQKWAKWLTELQAISRIGLTYSKDHYDIVRFKQLQRLASEMANEITDYDAETVNVFFEKEIGYSTPKLDVRGAIFDVDKVLLVRERYDQLWTLPGGWCDINESASEGAAREVFEETGYTAKVSKLIGLLDKQKQDHPAHFPHTYRALFLCEITGGAPKENEEIDAIDFFDLTKLPNLCPHRITESQIKLAHQHYLQPELATHFD